MLYCVNIGKRCAPRLGRVCTGFFSRPLTTGHPSLAWTYRMLWYLNNSVFAFDFLLDWQEHFDPITNAMDLSQSHEIFPEMLPSRGLPQDSEEEGTGREKHNITAYYNFTGNILELLLSMMLFYWTCFWWGPWANEFVICNLNLEAEILVT